MMCITVGGANRNLRIGIPNPIQKQKVGNRWVKAPRRAIASALADREFVQCWVFRLPIGNRQWAKTLRRNITM
jgi:hypothetical protein